MGYEFGNDIFEDRDANLIAAMPLANDEPDAWYRRKEKCGNYSVKSAYVLVQENKPKINSCGTPRF